MVLKQNPKGSIYHLSLSVDANRELAGTLHVYIEVIRHSSRNLLLAPPVVFLELDPSFFL